MKCEVCVLNVRLRSRCRAVAILLEVRELTLKWAVSRRQILNSFQTKGCTLMYWHHIDIIIIKQWLVFKDKCWINSKLYRRRNLLGHPLSGQGRLWGLDLGVWDKCWHSLLLLDVLQSRRCWTLSRLYQEWKNRSLNNSNSHKLKIIF